LERQLSGVFYVVVYVLESILEIVKRGYVVSE
jgi:hypothetical protein